MRIKRNAEHVYANAGSDVIEISHVGKRAPAVGDVEAPGAVGNKSCHLRPQVHFMFWTQQKKIKNGSTRATVKVVLVRVGLLLGAALSFILGASWQTASAQSIPVTAGYRDFYFGTSVNNTPTGEKPQSKLWWNDGIWWGCLWDPIRKTNTIQRFEAATQSWSSTGTAIDERSNSKADALWDGKYLYLVSHIFTHAPIPASESNSGRLYRYSYRPTSKSYSLDPGFPVLVNRSLSETLVLAKDSSGRLWVTWTEGGKVKINRTMGNDLTWGTPFDLPVQGNDVVEDDVSTIIAFGGNKIGVMWSNQNDQTTYFAVHRDGNADQNWEARETALIDSNLGEVSYDHLNLKPACDNDGNIYAATKTSLSRSEQPLTYVLKRDAAGAWTRYIFGKVSDAHTRPIILIDAEHRKLYVVATHEVTKKRWEVYMKSSDLDNIAFSPGLGTPLIKSETDTMINNPSSTKQCLSGRTGLLVIASDQSTRHYLHNFNDLGGDQNFYALTLNHVGPGRVTVNPVSGPFKAGTRVTLTATPDSGFQFNGWTGDLTGFANPATMQMDASRRVTAIFTISNGRGQVVHEETKAGGSSNLTSVATATALSGAAKRLYLAAIATKPKVSVSGVSGLGLEWERVKAQCSGRDQTGVELWLAKGTPRSSGIVSASFSSAPVNAVIAASRYAGADTANPLGAMLAGNPNGANGACENGVDNNFYTFDMTTTLHGAMVYTAATMRNLTHTPGAGFTERAEIVQGSFGPAASVAVTDRRLTTAGTVAVNGAFSNSADWAVIAAEIRPLVTMDVNGVVIGRETPGTFGLTQNYPNPFSTERNFDNPHTLINFALPEAGNVALNIYNELGQFVRRLVDGKYPRGTYQVNWNGRDDAGRPVAAGMYFYQIVVQGENDNTSFMQTKRMILF